MWREREAVQKNGSANRCAVTHLASAIKSALVALTSSLIRILKSHFTKTPEDWFIAVVSRCLLKMSDDFKMCSKDISLYSMFLRGRSTIKH